MLVEERAQSADARRFAFTSMIGRSFIDLECVISTSLEATQPHFSTAVLAESRLDVLIYMRVITSSKYVCETRLFDVTVYSQISPQRMWAVWSPSNFS